MTVFLRALYGPFGPHDGFMVGSVPINVEWGFIGIREDNRVGHWTLQFQPLQRKFVVYLSGADSKTPPEHLNAFVPDKPMVYGPTLVAIMRRRLSSTDTARCAALALAAR